MNWIDVTLLVVLVLFALRGYFRGFFREFFSLLGLGAGFIGAARYAEAVAVFFAPYGNTAPLIYKGIGFIICFFLVYVVFNLTGWLLHRSAKTVFLKTFNRFGGIFLGLGKGAALAALAVFTVTSTTLVPPATREKLEQSYLVSPLSDLADTLIRFGKTKMFVQEYNQARKMNNSRSA